MRYQLDHTLMQIVLIADLGLSAVEEAVRQFHIALALDHAAILGVLFIVARVGQEAYEIRAGWKAERLDEAKPPKQRRKI